MNTYKRLFSEVINPKLERLPSSINQFVCLSSNIYSLRNVIIDYKQITYFSNNYTTLLSSLSYNLPVFIEPYLNNLFDNIDHDIQQLQKLSKFLDGFDRNLILVESKISGISQFIPHIPYQYIPKYHNIIVPLYNDIKSSLNLVVNGFTKFKTNYIDKLIPDIRSNIESLSSFQPKLIESRSKIRYMPSIKEINEFKDDLYNIISDKNPSNIKSIETLLQYMKTSYNLSLLFNGLSALKSGITKEKNKLFQLMEKVKWWKSLLPGQISEEYRLRKIFQEREHLFPLYKEVIERINQEISFKEDLLRFSKESERFLSERSDSVESIIATIDILKSPKDIYIKEIKNLKFKFYNPRIIKDIFNKIQLIEIITTAFDRSKILLENLKMDKKIVQLNQYIKSIKNTLRWIEFIIERFKYIKSDILNLRSLKSKISLIKQQLEHIKNLTNKMIIILENLKGVEVTEEELEIIISTLNSIRIHFNNFNIKPFEKHLEYILNELEILKIYVKLFKKLYYSFLNFQYKIKSRLICVLSSVSDLECAIEGVPRNFILCSLLSNTENNTKKENNNMNNNVKVNKVNNNRMFNL